MTRIWVLSTDATPGALQAVIVALRLPLGVSGPQGWYSGASVALGGERGTPPADLDRLRRELAGRGYRADYA